MVMFHHRAKTIFTIMNDEVTTFNKEELALGVRFVDKNEDHKEFSEFVGMQRITASAILSTCTLNQLGLSGDNLRGQCYDGARNISGEVAGVQGIMK